MIKHYLSGLLFTSLVAGLVYGQPSPSPSPTPRISNIALRFRPPLPSYLAPPVPRSVPGQSDPLIPDLDFPLGLESPDNPFQSDCAQQTRNNFLRFGASTAWSIVDPVELWQQHPGVLNTIAVIPCCLPILGCLLEVHCLVEYCLETQRERMAGLTEFTSELNGPLSNSLVAAFWILATLSQSTDRANHLLHSIHSQHHAITTNANIFANNLLHWLHNSISGLVHSYTMTTHITHLLEHFLPLHPPEANQSLHVITVVTDLDNTNEIYIILQQPSVTSFLVMPNLNVLSLNTFSQLTQLIQGLQENLCFRMPVFL